jgi:transposase InsO family protein
LQAGTSRDEYLCHHCREPGHFRRQCPYLNHGESSNLAENDLRQTLNEKRLLTEKGNKSTNSAKFARMSEWYYSLLTRRSGAVSGNYCVDSGASVHMNTDRSKFLEIDETHRSFVTIANGKKIEVKGIGKVLLEIMTDKGALKIEMSDTLWVPELDGNLISVHQLTQKGFSVEFKDSKCFLNNGNEKLQIAKNTTGLYMLEPVNSCNVVRISGDQQNDHCIHKWHKRMAHRNLQDIKAMENEGLIIRPCDHQDVCEACIMGKMARLPFPKKATPTEEVLDCVVSDVCGPMQVTSLGGKKYLITFIDLRSGFTTVEFIREKSEVANVAINFIESVKTKFGRKIKCFRSDRGTEYLNATLQNYLKKEGILPQCTTGYSPEQNGVAERKNRILLESARTMLIQKGLPKSLWAEAVFYANYVNNRITSRSKKMSAFEVWTGKLPTFKRFNEFGCDVFVMIPTEKRRKLDPKAVKMKFVGVDPNAKGYRLVDENLKLRVSREVRFVSPTQHDELPDEGENDNFDICPKENHDEETLIPILQDSDEEREENDPPVMNLRRSARTNAGKLPEKFSSFSMYKAHCDLQEETEPKTLKEALESPQSELWKEAMKEELDSIDENETWTLTNLPPGRKAIGSKWVFKIKLDENGKIIRRKARLVAQGFSQKFGVDFDEVFAPVVRSSTFRLLISVAGERKYKVDHYDIKTAFLNGELEEEIYLKQPPGFEINSNVYKLNKSLYGLRQAARTWNKTLHEELMRNGFEQNLADKCLYVKKSNDYVLYILIHVDDLLAVYNNSIFASDTMKRIGEKFVMKNLGGVKCYTGIDVENRDGKFFISQCRYIDQIVEEAKLKDAKDSKFPVDTGYYKQQGKLLNSNEVYRKLIGMLLYLSTQTRPDIAASVAILSKRVQDPRDNDLVEVRRVIRYLKGSRNLKLKLNDCHDIENVFAFSDANWAEDPTDRKSNTGYLVSANGGAASWCCRKQDCIAQSSCESEYVALNETCKEIVYLIGVCNGLDLKINDYQDRQSKLHINDR